MWKPAVIGAWCRVGVCLQRVSGPPVDPSGPLSFAPEDRPVRAIAEPAPCERFGPRDQPGGFITRLVTGLYVPETQGVRPQPAQQESDGAFRQFRGPTGLLYRGALHPPGRRACWIPKREN